MAARWFCQGLSRPVWFDWIFFDTACEFVMRTRGGQARVHDRHDPDFRAMLQWPCPLIRFENWLEQKACVEPYHGGFLTIFPNWFIRIFPPR